MTQLKDNPLIGNKGLPLFDKIRPEHVVPAVKAVLSELEARFHKLETDHTPSWAGLLVPLEEMSLCLHHTWSPVVHLNGVKNSPELRQAYESVQGDVVATALKISQSQALFNGLKKIKNSPTWSKLDAAQQRIIEARLVDAELSGIALRGDERQRFNELSQELSKLANTFANNVLDATKKFHLALHTSEEIAGLPQSFLNLAAQAYNQHFPEHEQASAEAGPWLVTLDAPSFVPFMENSKRRDLREQVYRAYIQRAASEPFDNRQHCQRILQLRQEKARLLGYRSYAEVSLARKMAPSVEAVYKLEEELRQASWQPAVQELAELRELASNEGHPEPLANWDIAYWAKRLQEKRFEFNDEDLRPYFPLPRVLEGLFQLVERLFAIKVRSADGEAPLWHKDVRYFKIYDADEKQVAAFFLDPYSRPENKRGGAWMDECLARHRDGQKLILPVAYLVCNSTPPLSDQPSLMTFREVETLFHEFGHGLQHMLTRIEYLDASGINGVEWDAVELPSQFMENWCYHKATLFGMARHYLSGQTIPEELYQKLLAAKTFRAGQVMLRQLQFGMLDLKLHDTYDPFGSATPFDIQKEIAKTTSVIPPLPEDHFLCSFTHIFSGGYAAGYYSYKWAEVLSADAFSAFEEAGLEDNEALARVGRKFRDTVLALGGGSHPMDVFKQFRGREPSTRALLQHNGLIT